MKIGISFASISYSILLMLGQSQPIAAQTKKLSFTNLSPSQKINGFRATAVYLNDADQPMGGRFIHERTGFTLDLLQIESVPQTFIWVNTLPVSDKGEPHTQEHLLITKGNKGHELNTREGMSLATSNAFTSQLHTAYDFYTGAGSDVFYTLFEKYLDALVYPDYTDEEVHREVRNWGVAENAADKSLRIEEKGSVYNEMKTSMTNPYSMLYNTIGRFLYGNAHPLSFNAGGLPADIRVLGAADIKHYHDLNYHLGNMGAITSLPGNMSLESVLTQTDKILNRLQPQDEKHVFKNDLPAPSPAVTGKIEIVEYPNSNLQESGAMLFAYPADLTLSATEELLLANFLSVFSGDATSNLYKKFVDSKTREVNVGAQSVFGYVDDNSGQPVFLGVTEIGAANLTEEKAVLLRQKITDELLRVASFKDHSPELAEFNKRFKNSLINYQRGLAKFINSPPKFGFRNTYDSWYSQLDEMNKITSFKKSIILKPQFLEIEKLLAKGTNFWTAYIRKWKLTETKPYVVISKANPKLIEQEEQQNKERTTAEITRLKTKYNVSDDQQAIRLYKAEYDSNSAVLEKLEQSHTIRFIDNPPLTLDDQLDFKQTKLAGKVPLVASTFNNMSSATTGIAFNLDGVTKDKLVYLAMLPELLTQTGVVKDGKAISYEDMSQQLQQQILSLDCYYSTNFKTGRDELVVKGAGNNTIESQRSVEWMNLIMQNPYWRIDNISRIRDLVDQNLSAKRKTMQDAEEAWVSDPGAAYRRQDNLLLLATSSFLTQTHNIFRLSWMLKDAGNAENKKGIESFLTWLGSIKEDRQEIKKLLTKLQDDKDSTQVTANLQPGIEIFNKLPEIAKKLALDAAKDLEQILNDIPDESLVMDWVYLCNQMKQDLSQTPQKTLADLQDLRKSLLRSVNTRMFVVGSAATQQKLSKNINTLLAGLTNTAVTKINYPAQRLIDDRIKERLKTDEDPLYVGLVNPNSQTGVFMNSVPLVTYNDTSREQLLQFLAAQLHAGAGKQSVYTKSTGAGLSYSTGVRASPASGLFSYYAERTPLLPQTLSFVIDEIKRSPVDNSMSEYIISMAVSALRSASDYEIRGESMAADLADGTTPTKIAAFRRAVLDLRKMPGLMDEVYKRKDAMYEKIFPGYGAKESNVQGGVYYVIGSEKQMAAYEQYLKSKEGNDTKLYRIYPRDYWMILK